MFSSCQIENTQHLSLPAMNVWSRKRELSFSFWKNLTFQKILQTLFSCFFCCLRKCCACLIVWRDSVWTVRRDLVYIIVWIGRFAWFDESPENCNFDRIKKISLDLVWCLSESYLIKAIIIKHTFLWVHRDNKPFGMLGEYPKSL